MNINTTSRPWNYHSEVRCCETCEGLGLVPSHRRPTIDDPYPEQPCPDCDGAHLPECSVCGFNHVVAGYDCFACDTVASLTDADCKTVKGDELAAAVMRAIAQRRRVS